MPREGEIAEVCLERGVDLAGDVALEAADDVVLGLALGRAAFGVGAGGVPPFRWTGFG
jgi:hypothetical protein